MESSRKRRKTRYPGIYARLESSGKEVYDVVVSFKDADGVHRQRWQTGLGTLKEARAIKDAGGTKARKGRDPLPPSMPVREYAERWLAEKSAHLRPGTIHDYKKVLEAHVLPVIGNLKIAYVRPRDIKQVIAGMRERGLYPGGANRIMSSMFSDAVAEEECELNPVKSSKAVGQSGFESVTPNAAEILALIEAATGTLWEIPILLAATTGGRRGEVLGLSWSDVDLGTGRFTFSQALLRDPQTGELGLAKTKTEKGRRTFYLLSWVRERLITYREEQAQSLGLGQSNVLALRPDDGQPYPGLLICTNRTGGPLDPDAMTHAFKRLAKQVGLSPRMRLHDLRHGVATLLSTPEVPTSVASAVLGHVSSSFTMDHYQHPDDAMAKLASEALERAMAKGGEHAAS